MKKTNWKETLNLIIYHHKTSSIKFPISDIEDLRREMVDTQTEVDTYKKQCKQLRKDNDLLRAKLLANTLQNSTTESVSTFKVYA